MKIKLSDEKVESISFILWPIAPNGFVMNLGQYNISLNNYKLRIDGLESNHETSLDKNDYNIVKISVKEGKLVVNGHEKSIQFPDEMKIPNRIVTAGNAQEGFIGGISNILLNDK